ncbi:MAG: sensor domain-containing diguanylate cyclase [Myxococcota bacterium]
MTPVDLLAAMRRTVDQLAAFNDIAKVLTSTLELQEVLRLIGAKLSQILGAERWSLLLEHDDGLLHFELAQGPGAEKLKDEVLVSGEGIAGVVFASGKPKLSRHAREDPDFADRFDVVTGSKTGSVLAVPLTVRERVLGVLELVGGQDAPPFTTEDLRAAITIADFAAIAIDNARNFKKVQELTLTDEHTGLFNARHFQAVVEAEVARCARFARPLSLLFLDLDDFKKVNDTRGHLVGSAALKHAGQLLVSSIRGVDTAFRYGGDEFAVLLVETGHDGARAVSHRIVDAFRSNPFEPGRGGAVPLTVSVGYASFPDDGISANMLLQHADAAMYRAKKAGRNRVADP